MFRMYWLICLSFQSKALQSFIMTKSWPSGALPSSVCWPSVRFGFVLHNFVNYWMRVSVAVAFRCTPSMPLVPRCSFLLSSLQVYRRSTFPFPSFVWWSCLGSKRSKPERRLSRTTSYWDPAPRDSVTSLRAWRECPRWYHDQQPWEIGGSRLLWGTRAEHPMNWSKRCWSGR